MNAPERQHPSDGPHDPRTDAGSGDDRRFNLSSWALKHQQLVIFLIGLATIFGVIGYTRLAQSEDPPFTFRTMVIQTYWPGASAREVQEQITDRIGRQPGRAVRRQHQELLAPRRIDDFLRDEGFGAGRPGARNLVSGAQEGRRYPRDTAEGNGRTVLQRRIRRRLYQRLCARRRRVLAGAVARLRGQAARRCCACRASRRSTTLATRPSTCSSRSRMRS